MPNTIPQLETARLIELSRDVIIVDYENTQKGLLGLVG